MEFEKLYMFNPFTIQNADSKEIADTYVKLQSTLIENTDTGFQISQNIEIYANMNFLLGEMIARLQLEYDLLKTKISIQENTYIYELRKNWKNESTEKAPAMSYFEAQAKEKVQEDSRELAEIGARLYRFKKAYESIDSKQNALKKKIEAIRYEI